MSKSSRDAKRFKRENRGTKKDSWYCVGCNTRHPANVKCPNPRLYAKDFTRVK